MKIFIAATPDEYELPVFVATSVAELSRMSGCTDNAIYSGIRMLRVSAENKRKHNTQKSTQYKFFVVEVD